MQFGKSLLGGLVGAAIGIVLLLAVYMFVGIDRVWLSIPFALIVGGGVRMFVSTTGHASYLRGALTMLLALGGYIAGWFLVAQVATARANAPLLRSAPAAQQSPDTPGEEKATVEEEPAAPPPTAPVGPVGDVSSARRPVVAKGTMSTLDMILLGVAALLAYEMGRGSGASPAAVAEAVAEPNAPNDNTTAS